MHELNTIYLFRMILVSRNNFFTLIKHFSTLIAVSFKHIIPMYLKLIN